VVRSCSLAQTSLLYRQHVAKVRSRDTTGTGGGIQIPIPKDGMVQIARESRVWIPRPSFATCICVFSKQKAGGGTEHDADRCIAQRDQNSQNGARRASRNCMWGRFEAHGPSEQGEDIVIGAIKLKSGTEVYRG